MKTDFLTFGDSLTYGHELADAPHDSVLYGVLKPSQFAWPALLGATKNLAVPGSSNEKIFRTVVRFCSYKGPYISKIGVQWTFLERWDFRHPILEDIVTIGHWSQGDKNKLSIENYPGFSGPGSLEQAQYDNFVNQFYKVIYSFEYGLLNLLQNIFYCQTFLDHKNIDYFMMLGSDLIIDNLFDYKADLVYNKEDNTRGYKADSIVNNIIEIREFIDWSKFIFLEKTNRPYYSFLDMAKDNGDIGDHGHPLEDSHMKFADELRRRIF
tara:strand:- start:265 stop:1065 length:801 start_codon:yes stop_codon:yes gene_type:complete